MWTVLLLIAGLYRVEKLARERGAEGEDLRLLREQGARPIVNRSKRVWWKFAKPCCRKAMRAKP
jgi:hypothetical protein